MSKKNIFALLADVAFFALCYYLAFFMRTEVWHLGQYKGMFFITLPLALGAALIGYLLAGAYRSGLHTISVDDLKEIARGSVYGILILIAATVFLQVSDLFPRTIFLFFALLLPFAGLAARLLWLLYRLFFFPGAAAGGGKRVLIVGSGEEADHLITEMKREKGTAMIPVGIVDKTGNREGKGLQGVRIRGKISALPLHVKVKWIDEVIIAMPEAGGSLMRSIVEACRSTGVPYRTLPRLEELVERTSLLSQLRPVQAGDFYDDWPMSIDGGRISRIMSGRKVLVVGAGGSLGAELCRQADRFNPAEICFLDHNPERILHLDDELARLFPDQQRRLLVGDTLNRCRIDEIMQEVRPEVVIHAACHRHVWPIQANFREAFRTNVTGTRILAEAAATAEVQRFVLVSTHRASRPVNIAGLTMRLAEQAVQAMEGISGTTQFLSVRCGSTLAQEGGVVSLFERQIRAGGPVLVTHPDASRSFTPLTRAVLLLYQAMAMGDGGEIYSVLPGEKVRISDLARHMITLAGLEPERDMEIRFTGLRKGETLHEDTAGLVNGLERTDHEKILVDPVKPSREPGELLAGISDIETLVESCDGPREILMLSRELVPEYRPQGRQRV